MSDYVCLPFKNPFELLYALDPHLASESYQLHTWQIEDLHLFALDYTAEAPLKYLLRAANGSGKDSMIIAPVLVWLTLCKIQHAGVVTSSSGTQLSNQTEVYIRNLFKAAAKTFDEFKNAFKLNYRDYEFTASGSTLKLFATDEEGKAEGYHPHTPVSEMTIVVNEAKSVDEKIFRALSRCSGFNRWIEVSSPGEAAGHFYRSCMRAKSVNDVDVLTQKHTGWVERVVTIEDSPHISRSQFEEDKIDFGENSPLFLSKYYAQFYTLTDEVVVQDFEMTRALNNMPESNLTVAPLRAGLDLSLGGDETVFDVWQGNTQIAVHIFREKDSTVFMDKLITLWDAQYPELLDDNVNADDGGAGRSIIDMFHKQGKIINRVLNQSPPRRRKKEFASHGTEMYFNVTPLIRHSKLVFLPEHEILAKQLSTRHYKQSASGKIVLLSKKEEKSRGLVSPDRADAFVLAQRDITMEILAGEDTYSTDREQAVETTDATANAISVSLIRDRKSILQYRQDMSYMRDLDNDHNENIFTPQNLLKLTR